MLDRVTPIPAVQRKESKPESKKQPQNEGMRRNSDWHQDMFSMARNGQGGAPAQMKEEEPAAQKKEEEPAAQKKGVENAALQMKEEEPAAQKKEEEPAAQKKEEEPAAQKKEEEPAAQKKEEEPAAQKKEEEPAAQKKKEEEPAAQKKEEEPAAQKKEEEPAAQKKEEEPAAQKKEEEPAQKKEAGGVQTTSGKGRRTQMPGHVQRKMEKGLGADFGSTRIHADSEKASRMGAQAYTQGEDIYFAKDKYDPESKQGQELLGHELQHVVQQRDGRVKANQQEKGMGVNNERSLEGEADAKGKQVAEK